MARSSSRRGRKRGSPRKKAAAVVEQPPEENEEVEEEAVEIKPFEESTIPIPDEPVMTEEIEMMTEETVANGTSATDELAENGDSDTMDIASTEIPPELSLKRKHDDGSENSYDPSSPTSETESKPSKKIALESVPASPPEPEQSNETVAMDVEKSPTMEEEKELEEVKTITAKLPDLEKHWKTVNKDPTDFSAWTYLLQYVDQENDIEAAREAYDSFLKRYPYCYGYWKKYADYERKKSSAEACEKVFQRGLLAIPLSVDLWIHYLNYMRTAYENKEDHVRVQFERAIASCGLEFRSDKLWELYVKWETEAKQLQRVTAVYDRLLAVPTQAYQTHFQNFLEHVKSHSPMEVITTEELIALKKEIVAESEKEQEDPKSDEATSPKPELSEEADKPEVLPGGEQESPKTEDEMQILKDKIISVRHKVFKETETAVSARWNYEEGIKRPYFHVKALERGQLKNWHEYLEFEVVQGDQERILVLFERCLVACAMYDEFWSRYLSYLENLEGDHEERIRDVYTRACTVHHQKKPHLHVGWAAFEERMGYMDRASEILCNFEKVVPDLGQVWFRRINLERRRGQLNQAAALYEHYINFASDAVQAHKKALESKTEDTSEKKENSETAPPPATEPAPSVEDVETNRQLASVMVLKFAKFSKYILGDVDRAQRVLEEGLERDPANSRLGSQLIALIMERSPVDVDVVLATFDRLISCEEMPHDQRMLFAQRKLEFLEDFGRDYDSVQGALLELMTLARGGHYDPTRPLPMPEDVLVGKALAPVVPTPPHVPAVAAAVATPASTDTPPDPATAAAAAIAAATNTQPSGSSSYGSPYRSGQNSSTSSSYYNYGQGNQSTTSQGNGDQSSSQSGQYGSYSQQYGQYGSNQQGYQGWNYSQGSWAGYPQQSWGNYQGYY